MGIDLDSIDSRLRKSICPNCVRFTRQHTCSLPEDRPCSLFSNLDQIVEIVRGTHSPRVEPYLTVLRDQVCAACDHEDDHKYCPCREGLDCALDTYYPMIIETIERELVRQGVLED